MDLMKLPGLFAAPSKTASVPHRFFVIYFGEHSVRAGLWQVSDQKIGILKASTPEPWKEESALIDATDRALQQLGKESEDVKQTLFALEPTWVNQQGILSDKKVIFQRLTKELTLEAVGFVVIPEAIIQYQLNRKGNSLQCFVVEVLTERVSMTIVKNGKLGQQEMIGRSQNVVDDIKEGFARFQEGSLPSLVFLYSAFLTVEELEEARQRLLELDLLKDNTFMQQPTFEVITEEEIMDIILQTGGRAVGEARHLIDPAQPVMVETPPEADPLIETAHEPAELAIDPSLYPTPAPSRVAPVQEEPPMPTDYLEETVQPKGFGIPQHPLLFGVIGVVLGLVALAVVFLVASGQVMSAMADVQLKTQPVNKQMELKLDPAAAASDPNTGVLKAELIKQTVQDEKTADTTGKKIIGDKAKGKVTLFNRTSSPKTFPAGTLLKAGTKKYLLEKTETVASASTGSNFETKPGTLETTVIAADIGSESNIAKDIEMTVDTFSTDTYVARTASEIGGGTSREIKAVSQKDQDELLAALKKQLNDDAVKQLQAQQGSGKYVFPTNRIKVVSSKFSADVGKETNTLSLTMSVEAEALAYSAAELKSLAAQVVAGSTQAGYTVDENAIQLMTEPLSTATTSAQVALNTNITAVAKPQANVDEWKQQMTGMSLAEATALLKGKPEVADVKVILEPALFARFITTLPKDSNKIELKLR
jgi:hypothetical protein